MEAAAHMVAAVLNCIQLSSAILEMDKTRARTGGCVCFCIMYGGNENVWGFFFFF